MSSCFNGPLLSRWLLWIFVCLVSPAGLMGAGMQVQLTPTQPVTGEAVQLIVTLTDASGTINIQAYPQTTGIQFNWGAPQQAQSTQIINGHMTRSFTLTWNGTAGQKGNYQLSPLVLKVGSEILKNETISYSVGQQQTSAFYLLQTSVEQDDIVLGEMFHYHVDLCFAEQEIARYQRRLNEAYELAGRHYNTVQLPKAMENDFHISVAQGRQAQNGEYFGTPIGTRTINGFSYQVHRLTYLLEPKRSGRITIPKWNMAFYPLEFSRDFFGRATPTRGQRPIGAEGQAITIKVSPPPSQGQPDDFNGQVCRQLSLNLKMEDIQKGQTVQLHSPLSLTIEVASNLPSSANRPPLWKSQRWNKDFDVNTSALNRKDEDGKTIFSGIIIRPKNKDLTELPPLTISWYNASTKKYEQSQSEAFPFIVEAVDDQTILENQAEEVLSLEPKTKKKMAEHLYGLEMDPQRLFISEKNHWSWRWIVGIGGLLWSFTVWFWTTPIRKHWKVAQQQKSQFTSKFLQKKLQTAENSGAILEHFSKFICYHAKCQDPHDAHFSDANLQIKCKALLSLLEASQYAPGAAGDEKEKSQQAFSLAQEIERLQQNGGHS